jgi:hypothetical protein
MNFFIFLFLKMKKIKKKKNYLILNFFKGMFNSDRIFMKKKINKND